MAIHNSSLKVNIENIINFTFYNYVNSRRKVLNTGTTTFGVKELIYKVLTPTVFIVTHRNKRNTS